MWGGGTARFHLAGHTRSNGDTSAGPTPRITWRTPRITWPAASGRRLARLVNHRMALEAELRREAAQLPRADRAAQRGHAKVRERHARAQHLLAVLLRHPALPAPPARLEQRACASTQMDHVNMAGPRRASGAGRGAVRAGRGAGRGAHRRSTGRASRQGAPCARAARRPALACRAWRSRQRAC